MRLVADGRLLELDVKAPASDEPDTKRKGKTKGRSAPGVVRCVLPEGLRPSNVDDDRVLVLRAGERYEETFDPMLYCFGASRAKALVAGAEVTAKLGFAPRPVRKSALPAAPFVLESSAESAQAARYAPLKEIVAVPFTLTHTATSSLLASLAPDTSASTDQEQEEDDETEDAAPPDEARIEVSAPPYVDSSGHRELSMSVTIRNTGKRSTPMHARRDDILFEVTSGAGQVRCGAVHARRARVVDFATKLGPSQRQTFDVWLAEVCPDGTFDRPGLYAVRPILTIAGKSDGGKSGWLGTATATDATLVRVLTGPKPFYGRRPQTATGG